MNTRIRQAARKNLTVREATIKYTSYLAISATHWGCLEQRKASCGGSRRWFLFFSHSAAIKRIWQGHSKLFKYKHNRGMDISESRHDWRVSYVRYMKCCCMCECTMCGVLHITLNWFFFYIPTPTPASLRLPISFFCVLFRWFNFAGFTGGKTNFVDACLSHCLESKFTRMENIEWTRWNMDAASRCEDIEDGTDLLSDGIHIARYLSPYVVAEWPSKSASDHEKNCVAKLHAVLRLSLHDERQ